MDASISDERDSLASLLMPNRKVSAHGLAKALDEVDALT